MRPFKMFFGLSLAIMIFFFVAKFVFFAFIAAAVLSLVYAVFRRLKDFVTYDRFGEPYMKPRYAHPRVTQWHNEVEPLFYGSSSKPSFSGGPKNIRFIEL